MTPSQIILIVFFGVMFSGTLLAIARSWASLSTLVMWLAVWLLGLLAASWPEGTTTVASWLGIRRGADLLLYCTALGSILGFFMMYLRLRRVRRDLTVLTRQIAIRLADRQAAPEIDRNDQPSGGSADRSPDFLA